MQSNPHILLFQISILEFLLDLSLFSEQELSNILKSLPLRFAIKGGRRLIFRNIPKQKKRIFNSFKIITRKRLLTRECATKYSRLRKDLANIGLNLLKIPCVIVCHRKPKLADIYLDRNCENPICRCSVPFGCCCCCEEGSNVATETHKNGSHYKLSCILSI